MRTEIGGGVRPDHLGYLADPCVDVAGELAELRRQRDDRPGCRGAHDELREQPRIAEVDADVNVVERHVHRIAVGGLTDEHPGRAHRQLVMPVGNRALAEQRGALSAVQT